MPLHFVRKTASKSTAVRGVAGVGFKLTPDGNYDIDNKKLCNVSDPENSSDASSKNYVDNQIIIDSSGMITRNQEGLFVPKCLQLLDENNFDAENKKITNLKNPYNSTDAVNKKYMDKNVKIDSKEGNLLTRTEDGLYVSNGEIENLKVLLGDLDYREKEDFKKILFLKNNAYDANNKHISNVALPESDSDAATKSYVDKQNIYFEKVVFGERLYLGVKRNENDQLQCLNANRHDNYRFLVTHKCYIKKIFVYSKKELKDVKYTVYDSIKAVATVEIISIDETNIDIKPISIDQGMLITVKVENLPTDVIVSTHHIELIIVNED